MADLSHPDVASHRLLSDRANCAQPGISRCVHALCWRSRAFAVQVGSSTRCTWATSILRTRTLSKIGRDGRPPLCRVLGVLRPLRCTAMYRAAASLNVMDCVLASAAASASGIAARSVNVIIMQLVARGRLSRRRPQGSPCEASPSPFPEPPDADSIANWMCTGAPF